MVFCLKINFKLISLYFFSMFVSMFYERVKQIGFKFTIKSM